MFAKQVLNSKWWTKQREVMRSVATNRRVIVKSANGVGKTYVAADLCIWYLLTHPNSIVLTTAPTLRQVRNLLWEEIGRRLLGANVKLPVTCGLMRMQVAEGWFAMGLTADEGVSFQGFHAENLLIIMDEASGISDRIWDAAEGVAVGKQNKILAIGNPLDASGRFYETFRNPKYWKTHTISAMDHPNIRGKGVQIPGAVTREAITERIADWCEPLTSESDTPVGSVIEWLGTKYVPNDLFRSRVLGEFPTSSDQQLIDIGWVEAAFKRKGTETGICRMAVDVARFGRDKTVIGIRRGDTLVHLKAIGKLDTMAVVGLVKSLAFEYSPELVFVDSVGIGSGVVDRLIELDVAGVISVNVGLSANNKDRFRNKRAELYWGLRERLWEGRISLPQNDSILSELCALKYNHSSTGLLQIEKKEEMKKRGLPSPDHADMLAMLYDDSWDNLEAFCQQPFVPFESEAARIRREMADW